VENVLYALPLLACPVGMGLMMWLMMRRNKDAAMGRMAAPAEGAASSQTTADASQDDRLSQLRAHLGEVQAQQAAIADRIARLSAEERSPEPVDNSQPDRSKPAPPTRRAS